MRRDYVPLFASICTSEKLADLANDSHRLFYVLLLSQCDSWGRVTAKPRGLTLLVWGMFGGTVKRTEVALADLERVGLIEIHRAGAEEWIQVPDWEERAGAVGHSNRRGRSQYPDPSPESVRTKSVDGSDTENVTRTKSTQRIGEEKRGEESRGDARAGARGGSAPPDLDLSKLPQLDTPRFREAWTTWARYRVEIRKPLTPTGTAQQLATFATWGEARAVAAIAHTIEKGWQGLQEPDRQRGGQQRLPIENSARATLLGGQASAQPTRDVEAKVVA